MLRTKTKTKKDDFINWQKVSTKYLLPGVKIYRTEGAFTWVLLIGQANDYVVYVALNIIPEFAYRHGTKVDEIEALRIFPFLRDTALEFKT